MSPTGPFASVASATAAAASAVRDRRGSPRTRTHAASASVSGAASVMSTRADTDARVHSKHVARISAAGSPAGAPHTTRAAHHVTRTPAVPSSADGRRSASSARAGSAAVAVAASQ